MFKIKLNDKKNENVLLHSKKNYYLLLYYLGKLLTITQHILYIKYIMSNDI